jgi:hypothetical protein
MGRMKKKEMRRLRSCLHPAYLGLSLLISFFDLLPVNPKFLTQHQLSSNELNHRALFQLTGALGSH